MGALEAKIEEGVVRSFLLLGILMSVPILVKIDQDTDRHKPVLQCVPCYILCAICINMGHSSAVGTQTVIISKPSILGQEVLKTHANIK